MSISTFFRTFTSRKLATAPSAPAFVEPLEGRRLLSANLLANPNFSLGNTGFTSGLTNSTNLIPETTYAVGDNPVHFNNLGASFGDHTTGKGLMMIVNGATTPAVTVWQEKVTVVPGPVYGFSVWVASWGNAGNGTDPSPANLRISINNTTIVTKTVPSTNGKWAQITGTWHPATATSATIRIVDLNTAVSGNDFAMDDASFSVSGLPVAGSVFNDLNGNGTRDKSETGLAGWLVYSDANGNGQFDPGEASTVTDSFGNYVLNLKPGTYHIAVQVRQGYYETAPHSLSYAVTVGTAAISGKTFGVKAIAPA